MVSRESSVPRKAIESIYPLSPTQQGMLFHHLYSPDSRAFFLQVCCTLEGDLDAVALKRAWQETIDRHPVLRSAFVWEKLKQPLQVVQPTVAIPWSEQDWRSLPANELPSRLERFLEEDRQQGFSIAQAPLSRVTCLRTGEQRTELIWSHHHLILDGWCLPRLLQEVFSTYQAYCNGETPTITPPRPYQDYIQWLQQRDTQKAAAFWQGQLSGFAPPPPLDFGDRAKTGECSAPVYQWQTLELSPTLTERLRDLVQEKGCTLSLLFQGVWAILLARYTGTTDVVFGCLVSGRPPELVGVETMIGVFFNTLPTRIEVDGEASFLDWLARLRLANAERLQYADSSLAEIRQWSGISPDNPLFESVLAFHNYPIDEYFHQSESVIRLQNIQVIDRSDAPLTITVLPHEKLSLQIEYYRDRFQDDTIARLLGHFQTLLEAISRMPTETIDRLPWLTPKERHQLLVNWNATERDYPLDRGLHRHIESQVEKNPAAIALVYEGQKLTYQELNEQANQLAHHLQELGIEPQAMVGVLAERSLEMVIALLGILKAGGAYVPLDPELPADRLHYLLQDSGVSLLLAQEQWLPQIPSGSFSVFCLDRHRQTLAHQSTENLAEEVTGDCPAYTIYTSGSTGQPKGVINTHRGIVNRLLWMQEAYNLTPDDRVLQKTPFGFDVSVWEFFWPLLTGACLVIAKPGGHRDSGYLVWTIERERITTLHFVPSMLQVFLEEPEIERCISLRRVICSGEALPLKLQERFFERLSCELHNLYGPTEAAIDVSYYACSPDRSLGTVPIGRPIANTRLYILNENGQPVPIGVKGELHIGGVGLARGYLNRPELTSERFIADPFGTTSHDRLYKTGDLARYLDDGNIEYLGRNDNQIKLRGFRIELGEIEAALDRYPGLRTSAVSVDTRRPDSPALIAYGVPLGSPPEEKELLAFLRQTIPDYMLPSAFVWLERLPVTVNGKLDRCALPLPDDSVFCQYSEFIAPRNPIEEQMATIWSEVLQLDRIGVRDNFFALGGHSLLATRMIALLRSAFQRDLSVRDLFENPTLETLARLLGDRPGATTSPILPLPRSVDAQGNFVTAPSFAQEQLWLLEQFQGGGAYNMIAVVEIIGSLDISVLQTALDALVERHESLRSTFALVENELLQIVHPQGNLALAIVDLPPSPAGELLPELQERLHWEQLAPFVLAKEPPVRVTLWRSGTNHSFLSVTMHHTIADGWSYGIFLKELSRLYRALLEGKPSPLNALSIQYADFSRWQREYFTGEIPEVRLRYWQERLTGAPPRIDLPLDRPDAFARIRPARHYSLQLSPALTQRLQEFRPSRETTLFTTLLTALKILLFRWTGQKDLTVGTVVSGRDRVEIEPLIGCFINFLALRSRVFPEETGKHFGQRESEKVLADYAHQDCPFEKVVEILQPRRENQRPPLYNVALLLQNFPLDLEFDSSLQVQPIPLDHPVALLDLRLVAQENPEGLLIDCEYDAALFDAETIALLMTSYRSVLETLTSGEDLPIADFPIAEALQRQAERVRQRERKPKLVVSATFTAEPLEESLRFWSDTLALDLAIEFAPYHQVLQQLLDPSSLICRNQSGWNVLLVRLQDWKGHSSSDAAAWANVERTATEFVTALETAVRSNSATFFLCFCPVSTDEEKYRSLEASLTEKLRALTTVRILDPQDLLSRYAVDEYYDPESDRLGAIPYQRTFFTALGTGIIRQGHDLLCNSRYKVIALDCDGTLWGGVCGEEGAAGVRIEGGYHFLQSFIRTRLEAGKLLCLVSKNNQDDVWNVFERRTTPLGREDFIATRLNWKPKSNNLRSLADELGLGLDSFLFIDDNPIECAEVRANCPEVLTLQLPDHPDEIPGFLEHLWALDIGPVTEEDRQRDLSYRQNQQREQFRQESITFADFLAELELEIEIRPLTLEGVERVSQLTQRTNQFNLSTIRRSSGEIQETLQTGSLETWTVKVKDRFGDYGVVGVMMVEMSARQATLDTFLLSCRALGRGVEHRMLAALAERLQEQGITWVVLPYRPTPKNQPVRDFLERIGQPEQKGDQEWYFQFAVEQLLTLSFTPVEMIPAPLTEIPTVAPLSFPYAQIAREWQHCQGIQGAIDRRQTAARSSVLEYIAPRNSIEAELARHWCELLHLSSVSIHDRFFDIGGSSLLATRLVSALRRSFSIDLSLYQLFEAPTIAELSTTVKTLQVLQSVYSLEEEREEIEL
jgi:amino acid adenylation domain-containing protein/FkbH-like protein